MELAYQILSSFLHEKENVTIGYINCTTELPLFLKLDRHEKMRILLPEQMQENFYLKNLILRNLFSV